MEVLDIILGSTLSMGLTYAFVKCDRLRLPIAWRQRGWNAATTGAAIFTFAPLCIIAHFWVTRRSIRGILSGILALLSLLALQIALTQLYQGLGILSLAAVLLLHPMLLTLLLPLLVSLLV